MRTGKNNNNKPFRNQLVSLTNSDLRSKQYYLIYTVLFAFTALAVFGYFIYYQKSFVFYDTNKGGDGLVQAYNAFVYYGKYLRRIVRTLLSL